MSYLLQEDSEQPDDSGMEQKSSDGEDQRRKHGETDLRAGSGFGTGFPKFRFQGRKSVQGLKKIPKDIWPFSIISNCFEVI